VGASVVAADDAALGSGDTTRRWAVREDDGATRWPGVTRIEADAVCAALVDRGSPSGTALARVELGVVLSDGAGPYLVDADGCLILVVDRHPACAGWSIAMGSLATDRVRLGVVREWMPGVLWEWGPRVELAARGRVGALDDLADCGDEGQLQDWHARWGGA
jgi:hypothetical protein